MTAVLINNCPNGLSLSGYDKTLAIIVPYRDRTEHLNQFLPHMKAYFERDKLDRRIKYSIHVVEQLGTERFNSGKLKNCGFFITRDKADYFCFHDVDYLPIWADYSYCNKPCRLIWYGLVLREDYENFFGAIVMLNKDDFLKVNGYSNDYWGWGPEDLELGMRCKIVGLGFEKRDGTFIALPHRHRGFKADGTWTDESVETHRRFQEKVRNLSHTYLDDGLNTLQFELRQTKNLSVAGKVIDNIYHHKVRI
jgi:hypothetical protein